MPKASGKRWNLREESKSALCRGAGGSSKRSGHLRNTDGGDKRGPKVTGRNIMGNEGRERKERKAVDSSEGQGLDMAASGDR